MRVRGVVLLLLILVSTPAIAAPAYRFDIWTADTGLPQNIVTGIRQSRDGYLWIATLDGLARFDGVHFTLFDKKNTPGIRNSRFHSMFEDSDGDFWLRAEGGEVTRYRRGQFTTSRPGSACTARTRCSQFALAHKDELAREKEPT